VTDCTARSHDAWLEVGARAYRDLDLDAAEEAYRCAAQLRPESYDAWLGLARTLARQRRKDEAYATAERLLELAQERFEGHAVLGMMDFLTDQYVSARDHLQRAHALAPEEPEPLLTLAQVSADEGAFERARDELAAGRDLVARLPDQDQRREMEAFALHVETYVLLAEGRDAEAAEVAQSIVGMGDTNRHAATLAYSNLGILEARARNYDQAIDYLEHAYRMNPYFYRVGGALGRLLFVQRRYDRAVEVLGHVVEHMPDPDGPTHYAYGMALARVGRRADAREQFRLARDRGLRGVERALAQWQIVWHSPAGRYAVIALLLAVAAAWLLLVRPQPQTLVLLVVFLAFLFGRRLLQHRRR